MNPYYDPAKKHHTRSGFRNNYFGAIDKPITEVIKWSWNRWKQGLPKPPTKPIPSVSPDLAFLNSNASSADAMIPSATWIGHSSILVQANGLQVLTDPVFSERASPVGFAGPKRVQPPGLSIAQLPRIDVIVISHNHYDHLDDASVRQLHARFAECLFLVPLGLATWFNKRGIEKVVELDWWQSHTYRGCTFTLTPTQHWSSRSMNDRSKTLWGAWAVLGPTFHWYFGGDSGYCPDFLDTRAFFNEHQGVAQGGGFDLALLAIGAYQPRWFMGEQHVDPFESVRVHQDLNAKRSVAIHWGTFALTDESVDTPADVLVQARAAAGLSAHEFATLPIGATLTLDKRAVG